MKIYCKKAISIVISIFIISILSISPAFSQQEKVPAATAPAEETPAAPAAPAAPAVPAVPVAAPAAAVVPSAAPATAPTTDIAIYGEVQSINATASSMAVLCYDEETYEEKSIDLLVDKDTKLENAKALADIKEGDWVDATYVTKEGKNKATSVKVEKEEAATPAEAAPAAEADLE